MARTKIEWATDSWSPVTGCTPVSAGCTNCYARRMASRLRGRYGYPQDDPFKVTLHPDRLEQPLRWRKPRMIFACSMSDFFHPQVPLQFQAQMLNVMVRCPQHIFIILTKRHKQLASFNQVCGWSAESYPNIWLGVSVEDQKTADERIGGLLKVPAAVRLVSIEPMLSAIDIEESIYKSELRLPESDGWGINWIICGGETGPGARPMNPEWARKVRDQCVEAGVPYFHKQNGMWTCKKPDTYCRISGKRYSHETVGLLPDGSKYNPLKPDDWGQTTMLYRVPKKQAGRLLDGKEWNQIPEISRD